MYNIIEMLRFMNAFIVCARNKDLLTRRRSKMFRLTVIILTITAFWAKNIRFVRGLPKGGRASASSNNGVKRIDITVKPTNDKRLYRGLVLENDMKVLLISDPSVSRAAASMTLGLGSLNDFPYIPGLANFVGHMLFKGSKRPSGAYDFFWYLKKCGGFTQFPTTRTADQNFIFEIDSSRLRGTLQRFAKFFLEPSLYQSSDLRVEDTAALIEKDFVDQQREDKFRIAAVEKSIGKANHRYNHLFNGNFRTLYAHASHIEGMAQKSESLLKEARAFHRMFYSASIMNLVVLGKETLNQLEEIIVPLFSGVEKTDVIPIVYTSCEYHPWGPDQLKHKIYIVPLDETIQKVFVTFPTPDLRNRYKTAPDLLISYVLTHEAPDSLVSTLKQEGFTNKLEVKYLCNASGIAFFQISCHLTEKGLQQVDDVIHLIFRYIRLMSTDKEALARLYHEKRILQKIAFHETSFGNETLWSYVQSLSYNMQMYPLEDILSHCYFMLDRYKPSIVEDFLDYLTPDNMNVTIITQSLASNEDLQEEEYYKAKHLIEEIPEGILKIWRDEEPIQKLQLPPTNDFLPKQLHLYSSDTDRNEPENPQIIHKSSISELWFKQVDELKTYKVHVDIEIFSSISRMGTFERLLLHLFELLLMNMNRVHLYTAHLAGVEIDTASGDYSLLIRICAFIDTLPSVLEKLFGNINNLADDSHMQEENFGIVRKTWIDVLKVSSKEHASRLDWQMQYFLKGLGSSMEATLKVGKKINFDDMKKFSPKVFRRIFIRTFVHGNCSHQKAMEVAKILEESFPNSRGMLPQEILRPRYAEVEKGSNFVNQDVFKLEPGTYGSSSYFQLNSRPSALYNVLGSVFYNLIKKPCEKIMPGFQTKDDNPLETPLAVECVVREMYGMQGFFIVSITEKYPSYMDSRIEQFLRRVPGILNDIPDGEFERRLRNVLESREFRKATGLAELSKRYWNEIRNGFYNFRRNKTERELLSALKKTDLINFFRKIFGESSSQRRKLAVHLYPDSTEPAMMKLPNKAMKIEDGNSFRLSTTLLPISNSSVQNQN